MQERRSKIFGKAYWKTRVQRPFSTLFEKSLMQRFFSVTFSEQLFYGIVQTWIAASELIENLETLTISEDLHKSLNILTIIVDFTENIWDFSVTMKQCESRIESMILLRKWNINESHWPHTLQIYTVWKPWVEIGMEISLNLGFYRFLLQRNVDQFNFIFFKEYFFTRPVI